MRAVRGRPRWGNTGRVVGLLFVLFGFILIFLGIFSSAIAVLSGIVMLLVGSYISSQRKEAWYIFTDSEATSKPEFARRTPTISPIMGPSGNRHHIVEGPETLVASEVANYFPICPICYAQDSVKLSAAWNFVSCEKCGVKWEVRPKLPDGQIDWLELVTVATGGAGAPWVGIKEKPEFWRQMGLEQALTPDEVTQSTSRKELSSNSLRSCTKCGQRNMMDAKYCGRCGAELQSQLPS